MDYTENPHPVPLSRDVYLEQYHHPMPVSPSDGLQFAGPSNMVGSQQPMFQQSSHNLTFNGLPNEPAMHLNADFGDLSLSQPVNFDGGYPNQRVAMWGNPMNEPYFAQNDSGLHSGSHRSAVSTSGRSSHLDVPMEWGDSSQQVSALQSGYVTPFQPFSRHQQGSTTPSQNFDTLEELERSRLPELEELLKDLDPIVSARAAGILLQLSSAANSDGRAAICRSRKIMQLMISIVGSREKDETTRKLCAGTLNHISYHADGLQAIIDNGGIPMLKRMLSESIPSLLYYSLATVHNLLFNKKIARDKFLAEPGIIEDMVMLLKRDSVKFLSILTECIRLLLQHSRQVRPDFQRCGGCEKLVHLLCTYDQTELDYIKLRAHVVKTLKLLSSCAVNKPQIIRAGGMRGLSSHIKDDYEDTGLNCLITLRNLSDVAVDAEDSEKVLPVLVEFLEEYAENVIEIETKQHPQTANPGPYYQALTYATGIVHNLTCNKSANKLKVCQHAFGRGNGTDRIAASQRNGMEGIDTIMKVLNVATMALMPPTGVMPIAAETAEEFVESAMCTLRNLTAKHAAADEAQRRVVMNCHGLSLLQNYLSTFLSAQLGADRTQAQRLRSIIKAACGVIRNLTQHESNQSEFLNHCMPYYMQHVLLNLKKESAGNEDLLHECLYALQAMVLLHNKSVPKSAGTMPPTSQIYGELIAIAAELLFYSNGDSKIHRTTTALLSELTNDGNSAQLIINQLDTCTTYIPVLCSIENKNKPKKWAHLANLSRNVDEKANTIEKELYRKLLMPPGNNNGVGPMPSQYAPIPNTVHNNNTAPLPSPVVMTSSGNQQYHQQRPKHLPPPPPLQPKYSNTVSWPPQQSPAMPVNPANTPDQYSNVMPTLPSNKSFGNVQSVFHQQTALNSQDSNNFMLPNKNTQMPSSTQNLPPRNIVYTSSNNLTMPNNTMYANNDLVQAFQHSSIDDNNGYMSMNYYPIHQQQQQSQRVHPQAFRTVSGPGALPPPMGMYQQQHQPPQHYSQQQFQHHPSPAYCSPGGAEQFDHEFQDL